MVDCPSTFIDIWHIASLASLIVPFLIFAIAFLIRIDAEIFHEGQAAIFLVYLITVAVGAKLFAIIDTLHAKGKLLPIRFLLSTHAIFSLVIALLVGFTPEMIRGDMMRDEFSEYNAQISVLLFHTSLISMITSASFSARVAYMLKQEENEDLNSVLGSDVEKAGKEDDYQVL